MSISKFVSCAALASALLVTPVVSGPAVAQQQPKMVLSGGLALWTVAVKPDRTAQYEELLGKVRTALKSSDKPERQEQARHWKVVRMSQAMPDGNIGYLHIVSEPVKDADYTVIRILYEGFPDEARALYDQYMECFAGNVSLASGTVAMDMASQ